jgi:FkbM family methyltransferase
MSDVVAHRLGVLTTACVALGTLAMSFQHLVAQLPIEPTPANLLGCLLALVVTARLLRSLTGKSDPERALFPHGPVHMQMKPGGHTFVAPDKTLMRVLFKEIYTEQCYDSAPLQTLKDLTAEACAAKRPVVVFDVGGATCTSPAVRSCALNVAHSHAGGVARLIPLMPNVCVQSGNVGVFARYAAEAVAAAGGTAEVHSFEPLPPVHGLHKRNTGELDGVTLHNFGLCAGDATTKPATVTFEYFPGLPGNGTMKFEERDMFQKKLFASTEGVKQYLSQLASTSKALRCLLALVYPCRALLVQRFYAGRAADHIPFECELRTASSVIRSAGISVIDLLKIDVEGAELDVMQGIETEQWKIVRQVVAEVHDHEGRLQAVQDLLRSAGFDVTVEQEEMFRTLGQPTYVKRTVLPWSPAHSEVLNRNAN